MRAIEYQRYLLGRGLSRRTAEIYTQHVQRFLAWCRQEGLRPSRIAADQVADFAGSRPWSNSTRRQLRTALKHYWEATGRERPPLAAVRVPPKPRMVCKALDEGDTRRLTKVASGWWPKGTAVLLGLYLALRRAEIAALRWDAFDADLLWATVQGKHGVVGTLPVHARLRVELLGRRNGTPWVFPSPRHRDHVHPATVWQWTREVAEEAGLPRIATHQLRHTSLATANDRTGDLRAVQTFARHARPEMTAGYTRTTATRLQEVVEALDYE